MQRTSVWLVVRMLGLIVVAAVVLFQLATPRTTVLPGDEDVPQQAISQEPGREVGEGAKPTNAGLLADGGDGQKARAAPAAAGMGQASRGDGPARAD